MDKIAIVLNEVANGKTSFGPDSKSDDAVLAFQDIARCLIKANNLGYIEKIHPVLQALTRGDLAYTDILVIGGLTYDGREYLDEKWTQQTGAIADNLDELGSSRINVSWQKCLERLHNDPEGAITSSRSLLEDVLKHVLDLRQIEWRESETLQQLFKKVLNASTINNDPVLVRFIGSCNGVVGNLSEIRNRYGDAHGHGIARSKIDAACARLVVNVAGSLASYITDSCCDEK
jgi:hypothetical protein